jgi:mRNA-degrading endonuclease RelE of RelBE toxin-antitoxin system
VKIVQTHSFKTKLNEITNYIKKDKQSAAVHFTKKLKQQVLDLKIFPLKYKQSLYFDNENIRDMTYSGYTIVYEVIQKENIIYVLDIFNKNKPC